VLLPVRYDQKLPACFYFSRLHPLCYTASMKKNNLNRLNQAGFTPVSVILLIFVVILTIFIAVQVNKVHDTKTADGNASQNAGRSIATSSNSQKVFTDNRDHISIRYPKDWSNSIYRSSALASDVKGPFLTGAITSPSGKLAINYTNFITGVGDPGCGTSDLSACPIVYVSKVEAVPNFKQSTMKFIEKITYWKGSTELYVPSFGLTVQNADQPIAVGTIENTHDFFLRTNFTDDGGYLAYNWAPAPTDKNGFKIRAEAQAFLDSPEAQAAEQIILSVKKS
jgi:hypothetical protein